MPFLVHHLDNLPEQLKVVLFLCMQRILFEVRNHFCRKVLSIPDDENECPISPASTMIRLDDAATQSFSNRFEDVFAALILADMEFRDCLPSDSYVNTALKGNVKAAFTVDKTRDVMIVRDSDLSC